MADPTTVEIAFTRDRGFEAANGRTRLAVHGERQPDSWMPTELFLSGLGSCMLATLVHVAAFRQTTVDAALIRVTGQTVTRPTRFGSIHVAYHLPDGLPAAEVDALIRAAGRCKVHNTLTSAPMIEVMG